LSRLFTRHGALSQSFGALWQSFDTTHLNNLSSNEIAEKSRYLRTSSELLWLIAHYLSGARALKLTLLVFIVASSLWCGGCAMQEGQESSVPRGSQARGGSACEPQMNGDGSVWRVVC